MQNNEFSNDNTQFVLSYELLSLLRWLAEHDAEKLKKLITKALANGLQEDVNRARKNRDEEQVLEEIQHGMLDFFNLLEILLAEAMDEQTMHKAMQKNLMPAIDQIDATICDDATVRTSIERATAKIEHNSKENPKDILFKELLKRWKPVNKNAFN
ncbi:MAG: hypothetical protein NTX86_02210 [Candidatus Dependentiae bacterium]|nr:hypothetical protein [Candidatus Dependentiae bacterium]